jgi:hypothetical protein
MMTFTVPSQKPMTSTLAWIDHDEKARERTLRILSLFQEKESCDELGIGAIRDSFAEQLFPGTSTIQTRLRYMLFVPWIYRELENKRVPPEHFSAYAERQERSLVEPLLASEDRAGIFGKTAGKHLKRLPSSVYWAGLGVWGIRFTPFSQDEYHRGIGEIYRQRDEIKTREKETRSRGDDPEGEQCPTAQTWHPRIPARPNSFPDRADIALTREEASFILDRIQVSCPGSLLAHLALHCKPSDTDAPWNHPDYAQFSPKQKELLTHARLFSEIMHGAALIYNIMLAELRGRDNFVEEHRHSFNEWSRSLRIDEIKAWSLSGLWGLTIGHGHTIALQTKRFIEDWVDLTRQSPTTLNESSQARELIKRREMNLKRSHSRFTNHRALEQWSGYSGLGKLVYRWPNVKVLLKDLYQGLQQRGASC